MIENKMHAVESAILKKTLGGMDTSGSKLSASHAGDLGSNPVRGLTQVTQCMNERGRDYLL